MKKSIRLFVLLTASALLLSACGSSSTPVAAKGGTVSGRLAGAAGGTVTLDGTRFTTPIARDGTFAIVGVPAGEYTVTIKAPGNSGAVTLVRVRPDRPTHIGPVDLRATGQLAGKVTNTAGQPVAGARVLARLTPRVWAYTDALPPGLIDGLGNSPSSRWDDDMALPPRVAITNAQGAYAIGALRPGPYSITVTAPGYVPSHQGVVVRTGSTSTANVELTTVGTERGTLSGTVLGVEDNQTAPLSAVRVDVWPVRAGAYPQPQPALGRPDDDEQPWAVPPFERGAVAFTDAQGRYDVGNLVPGEYRVIFWRYGYSREERAVRIAERANVTLNATLRSNLVRLSGTVRGTAGDGSVRPLANAWVAVSSGVARPGAVRPGYRPDDEHYDDVLPVDGQGFAQTDDQGRYSLTAIGGQLVVSAWAADYHWNSVRVDVPEGSKSGVDLLLHAYVAGDDDDDYEDYDDGNEGNSENEHEDENDTALTF